MTEAIDTVKSSETKEAIICLMEKDSRNLDFINRGIAQISNDPVPFLIDIMMDDSLAMMDSRGEGYFPITATSLLADINDVRAIKPMVSLLSDIDPMSVHYGELERCLSLFAKGNLDFLLDIYGKIDQDDVKDTMCNAFDMAKIVDDRVFALHLESLKRGHEIAPT